MDMPSIQRRPDAAGKFGVGDRPAHANGLAKQGPRTMDEVGEVKHELSGLFALVERDLDDFGEPILVARLESSLMPKGAWQMARDRDAARRAKQPDHDDACNYETHSKKAREEKDLDERVARMRIANIVWRSIKESDPRSVGS